MNAADNVLEEKIAIPHPDRRLEGVLTYAAAGRPAWSLLIAGPHPFLGGDRRNNVVTTLARRAAGAGALALTFNYAGVGESEGGPEDWPAVLSAFWNEGRIDAERDWADDTAAARDALRRAADGPLVLAGYSFGCWTVSRLAAEPPPRARVWISPNPKRHDFRGLAAASAPLLVVHSDNDFACPAAAVAAWFDGLPEPKARVFMHAGEHFFRGAEAELAETVLGFLARGPLEGVLRP